MKKCKECFKEFKPVRENQVYCSKRCCVLFSKRSYLNRTRGKAKWRCQKSIIKPCPVCGKPFKNWASTPDNRKSCSVVCRKILMKRKYAKRGFCVICNKEITAQNYFLPKYCSDGCRETGYQRLRFKRGSKSRYRINAFDVYGKHCSDCGYDQNTDILVVHHKNHNRKDGNIKNLVILCPNCHAIRHLNDLRKGLGLMQIASQDGEMQQMMAERQGQPGQPQQGQPVQAQRTGG